MLTKPQAWQVYLVLGFAIAQEQYTNTRAVKAQSED